MKHFLAFALLFVPASLPRAAAPDPAPPADLAALLLEAEASSPVVLAAQARLEAARLVPSQRAAPADPEVSLAYTNDGVSSFTLGESDMTTLALTWTQEAPYPGKLALRAETAEHDVRVLERSLERARLEVAAAVKIAYADVYRADRTLAILLETRGSLETVAQSVRRSYEVGQGIQEAVLKAETRLLALDAEIVLLEEERRAAAIRLNRAVGVDVDRPVGPAGSLPAAAVPAEAGAAMDDVLNSSPEIRRLDAMVSREEAAVRLARVDLKPDFVWSASYMNRGDLDPMVAGMFGVRLPIRRDRLQSQALRQAERSHEAARRDLQAGRVQARAEILELLSRAERADRMLAILRDGVIPVARLALESARASYAVGRLGFLEVLDDLEALFEARSRHVAQEAERLQALAALEPLLGRDLVPVPAPATGSAAGR